MFNINKESNFSFFCDKNELSGVVKIANKVCNDVKLVVGKLPELQQIESLENIPAEENQISYEFSDSFNKKMKELKKQKLLVLVLFQLKTLITTVLLVIMQEWQWIKD